MSKEQKISEYEKLNNSIKQIEGEEQLPPRWMYGPFSKFFNFGLTRFEVNVPEIIPRVRAGTSYSGGAFDASLGIEFQFTDTTDLSIRYVIAAGKNNINKTLNISIPKFTFKAVYPSGMLIAQLDSAKKTFDESLSIGVSSNDLLDLIDSSLDGRKDEIKQWAIYLGFRITLKLKFKTTITPSLFLKQLDLYKPGIRVNLENTSIKITDVNIQLPDWSTHLPNMNNIKTCIEEVIQMVELTSVPCIIVSS